MNKNALFIFAALIGCSVAHATPTTITTEDASALFGALSAIQPGLSPSNVGLAAENIWLLKGVAEAYQSAAVRYNREQERAKSSKDPVTDLEKLDADMEKYGRSDKVTLDLQPITLSDEEIKEAKITPALLAPIKHYLSVSPSKK